MPNSAKNSWVAGTLTALLGLFFVDLAAAQESSSRVIAVGGSVTEIVYALEQEDRLIAADSTSTYPPAATDLPDIGYIRTLSAEPILALAPDLILAEPAAGPPVALTQIRDAGVALHVIPDEPTPQGVLTKIEAVADALGVPESGTALAARVKRDFADLERKLAELRERPRVLFLLSMSGGAPLAAGRETAADAIIRLAGGRNAVTGYADYKPFTPEAAVDLAPDVILINAGSGHSPDGGREAFLARPEIAATPAGRNKRVIAMDGLLLLGFGPRTPEAARRLAADLHPELQLADASDE